MHLPADASVVAAIGKLLLGQAFEVYVLSDGQVEDDSDSDDEDIPRWINAYISNRSESDTQLWPLVKRVVVKCNSPILQVIRLFDVPGANDINSSRDRASSDALSKCPIIIFVALYSRAVSDATLWGERPCLLGCAIGLIRYS